MGQFFKDPSNVIYKKTTFLNDSKGLKIKIWIKICQENVNQKKTYLEIVISDNIKVNAALTEIMIDTLDKQKLPKII